MTSQSIEVVTGQITHGQRLERGVEVMRALETQQSLFEVTPSPDLWRGTEDNRNVVLEEEDKV